MDYIRTNSATQDATEIANILGRPPKTIRQIIERERLPTTLNDKQPGSLSRSDMRQILQQKAFYKQVKHQLSKDELLYFEEMWLDSIEQFDMDIRPTEELQLKRLLLLDIHADRINIRKREDAIELGKKQALLNVELGKPSDERDRDIIQTLQNEISAIRSSIQNGSREAKDLISESKHIQKDLKATRDQRSDTIDDSKVNFVSWLKVVQEAKYRKSVSAEMEVLKLSTEKAKERMGDYIEYADGTVERQLLNHETVTRGKNNEQEKSNS